MVGDTPKYAKPNVSLSDNLNDYEFLGFGVGGFRGFSGDEIQRVGPFGKVHLLAGQNNSGKSSLVVFCKTILMNIKDENYDRVLYTSEFDTPLDASSSDSRHFLISLAYSKEYLLRRLEGHGVDDEDKEHFEVQLDKSEFTHGNPGVVWVDFDFYPDRMGESAATLIPVVPQLDYDESSRFFQDLSLAVTKGADDERTSCATLLESLCDFKLIPTVKQITAVRHVHKSSRGRVSGSGSLTGEDLSDRLSAIENPEPEDRSMATRQWNRFQRIVRRILNDPEAEVDVSSKTHSITVRTGETDFLPLSSLGTGIEELVILSAEIATTRDSLICIEEPEIHLHPSLQARFMRCLMDDEGGNRFLVTTHSATVINTPGTTITLVTKRDGACTTRPVKYDAEVRDTLDELGARPSDLLQTDYLIWVEGPSDRIYLRSWLRRVDPVLQEGSHYSVMFYGGKLLNSLSAEPGDGEKFKKDWAGAEDDLVSLFRMSTHFCVVMDSDRPSEGAGIDATKERIKRECQDADAMCWVTDGRTIENYVPEKALRKALVAVHRGKEVPEDHPLGDPWVCPLSFVFENTESTRPNKIAVARWLEESQLDGSYSYEMNEQLGGHVKELARAIRDANGMGKQDV